MYLGNNDNNIHQFAKGLPIFQQRIRQEMLSHVEVGFNGSRELKTLNLGRKSLQKG